MKPFNRRDPSQPYRYDYYRHKGYTVCRGPEGYNSQKNADKILLVDTDTTLKKWLPYVIEREPGKLGLEFMVQAGIEKLYKKKNKKYSKWFCNVHNNSVLSLLYFKVY